ncbi:MAG: hypothetical protein WHX53_04880 [Anaerolineae bacterium]
MGPVEIVFLTVWVVFGLIGVARGIWRELGATTMLLITLMVVQLLTQAGAPGYKYWMMVMTFLAGEQAAVQVISNSIATIFTLVITFISYEGETLTFPGKGTNWFFSLGTGLLNGYLFAGSIWYYLDKAGWPGGLIKPPFTEFYSTMLELLPPAVLPWWLLVILVVFMMIMRVIK